MAAASASPRWRKASAMLGYREEKDSRSPGAGEIWSCVPPPPAVCSRATWRAFSSCARSSGCRNVLSEPVVARESELPWCGGCHGPDDVDGHSLGVVSEILMMSTELQPGLGRGVGWLVGELGNGGPDGVESTRRRLSRHEGGWAILRYFGSLLLVMLPPSPTAKPLRFVMRLFLALATYVSPFARGGSPSFRYLAISSASSSTSPLPIASRNRPTLAWISI